MPMVPLFTRLHDLAFSEMRTLTLLQDTMGVPPGEYGLLELYCNEEGCDCRRVHLQVVTPPPDSQTLANINFGWEAPGFYRKWGSSVSGDARGPFLDPLNPQSSLAPALLELVASAALSDQKYVKRLARHYTLFKAAGQQEPPKKLSSLLAQQEPPQKLSSLLAQRESPKEPRQKKPSPRRTPNTKGRRA